MMGTSKWAAVAAAFALGTFASAANATVLTYTVGDVTSGSFGDAHIKKGNFTDTLAFTLPESGEFSASLISSATRLKKAGDLNFTSVTLTGGGNSYDFAIQNNGGGDGLTDSASFTGMLGAGAYLLTIKGLSYANAQFGGNTSLSIAAVPEAATWLSMVLGFALVGNAIRGRRRRVTFA